MFPRSNNFCYPSASKALKQSFPPALGQGCSLPLGGRIWEAPKGCLLILGQILESPPQIPVKLSSLGLRLSLLLFYVVTNMIFKGDFLPWHSAPRKKGKEGGGRKDLRTCCYTSPIQYTASTNPSHCLCCHQVVTRISQGGKKAVPNWPTSSHWYVTKRPQALHSPVPSLSEINYWAPTDSNWVTSCMNDQLRPKAGVHFAAKMLLDTHINQC